MADHRDLPALFAWIEEQSAAGVPGVEIASTLDALDRYAFDEANEQARAAGATTAQLVEFWTDVARFGDSEPADMIDSSDALYDVAVPD